MRRIFIIVTLLAILGTLPARAVVHTSEIVIVKIPFATEAELDETVFESGALVYIAENPHDVRVGDGVTPGGYRIWNTAALTAPPTDWYTDVDFHGHTITLNERYGFATAGSTWSLLSFGSSILDVVSDSTALGVVMSTTYDAPNTQMVVTVGVEDTNVVPIVEWSETSVAGPWTTNATWSSTAVDTTIVVRVDIPETSTSGYVRISAVVEEYFDFGLPIRTPGLVTTSLTYRGTELADLVSTQGHNHVVADITDFPSTWAWASLTGVPTLASNWLTDVWLKTEADARYLQTGGIGAWTNLSDYNNDLGIGVSVTNLTDLSSAGQTDTNKVARPDGAGGVEWGSLVVANITDFPSTWAWSGLTDVPVDLAGYGITDAWTRVESDARYLQTGGIGAWTNLSDYNNDLGIGVSVTNLTDLSSAGEVNTNKVAKPDGAGGVEWGDLPANSGGMDPAIASNSFFDIAGDTVTGPANFTGGFYAVSPLASNELAVVGRYIANYQVSLKPGHTSNPGVVITNNSNDNATCPVIIGTRIVLVGTSPDQAPVLLGANVTGVRIGTGYYPVSIGRQSMAQSGVTVGDYAKGGEYAVVMGPTAQGTSGAVRVGYGGSATTNSTALGYLTNNDIPETTRLRGSLYLDGSTGIFFRTTFGTGTWGPGLIVKDASGTNELFAVDPDGNETQLSAHDVIDGEMRSVAKSHNKYTGKGVMIDLETLAAEVEKLSGAKIVHNYTVPKTDWDAEQAQYKAKRDEERAAWSNAYTAYAASPVFVWTNKEGGVESEHEAPDPGEAPPPAYKVVAKPTWLSTALEAAPK